MDELVTVVRARRGERAWAVDDRGRLVRVRDNLASFGVERELGLASTAQLARRAATSTVKILLPAGLRGAIARRRPDRRSTR
jgi:hypothetical protein